MGRQSSNPGLFLQFCSVLSLAICLKTWKNINLKKCLHSVLSSGKVAFSWTSLTPSTLVAPRPFLAIFSLCLGSFLRASHVILTTIPMCTNHLYRQRYEYGESNSWMLTCVWWRLVCLCQAWESLVNFISHGLLGNGGVMVGERFELQLTYC